jgi:hypothetical protein
VREVEGGLAGEFEGEMHALVPTILPGLPERTASGKPKVWKGRE